MDHIETFLLSELFCPTPPSCLKVYGGGWVVGLQDFSVGPSPLLGFLGLGTKGIGDFCFFFGMGTYGFGD